MRPRLTVDGAATRIEGPLLFLRRTVEATLNEAVEVVGADGQSRPGRVVTLDEEHLVIEVLESTAGLALAETRVRFIGEPLSFAAGPGLLGRVFNGVGRAIDGGPPVAEAARLRIDGLPVNPVERDSPRDFIETGISTIDLMNSLVRGQKLPLFSGGGLPHDRMAAQIAIHARLRSAGTHEWREGQESASARSAGTHEWREGQESGNARSAGTHEWREGHERTDARGRATQGAVAEESGNERPATEGARSEEFVIVFAGIGLPHESAEYFRRTLEESGALARTALFLNLASDSSTQRLLTPRFALTAAEYLAFREGRHVLAILTDMTNYCEALREVSSSHGEIPSRKGYPGYLYSDLASLYERAGRLRGRPGTLTQLPILTMPADDIGHPVPDLSGYITEGQIVIDRELDRRGLYPPVKVLPSLSRLMKDGTGERYTHADHPALASQLFAAYARAAQARILAGVVGEEGLSDTDRRYLEFGRAFEQDFVHQEHARRLEESMAAGWSCLRILPRAELTRLSDAQLAANLPEGAP